MSEQLLKEILESQQLIIKTLQKHSSQLDQFQKNQIRLETSMETIEHKTDRIDIGLLKLETRMETEVVDKIHGLFDARNVQNDVNQRIISTLDRLETKVDVLQMETAHIRRVK